MDFYNLKFLPVIKSRQELLNQRSQNLYDQKIMSKNRVMAKVTGQNNRDRHKEYDVHLGSIVEQDEPSQTSQSPTHKTAMKKNMKKVLKKLNNSIKTKAERFDFRINNQYKISNIEIDPKGERIFAKTNGQVRVVSKDPIRPNLTNP